MESWGHFQILNNSSSAIYQSLDGPCVSDCVFTWYSVSSMRAFLANQVVQLPYGQQLGYANHS